MRNNKIELPDNNTLIEFMVIANMFFDGHFQINKFTSNYKACFGTPEGLKDGNNRFDSYMFTGETMTEAMKQAIAFFVVNCEGNVTRYYDLVETMVSL